MAFEYRLIEKAQDLADHLSEFSTDQLVYSDTESTSLKWDATLLGLSFYQQGVKPCFVVNKTPYFQDRGIPLNEIKEIVNPFLRKTEHVFHNAKYDLGVFDANGFVAPNVKFDTMLEIHLANPALPKKLETRVAEDFKYAKKTLQQHIGLKWDKIPWNNETYKVLPLETLGEYAAEDVYWLRPLHEMYWPKLVELKVEHIHNEIELPLCYVLKDMKKAGVRIDKQLLLDMRVPCEEHLALLERKIHKMAGVRFNIGSPKQLGEVLYDKLGYRCNYMTAKGQRATDKNALLDLRANQGAAIASELIAHSALKKLLTGYIDAIPLLVDSDGRLRCEFNSEGAETGRFSSSNPNLQNQPNNKNFPVRAAFVAGIGRKLVVYDWSQIELRFTAHLSKDARLMQAFIDGRDIHTEVAEGLKIERKHAKTINFAILYGLGPKSLAHKLELPESAARKMLDDFGATYPGVIAWKKRVETRAKIDGFVRNMFGRLRPLAGVHSSDMRTFSKGLRQAVNTQVQGTCADVMKIGMLRIYNWIKKFNIDARLILCVHDEVVIDAAESCAELVAAKVKEIMESVVPIRVPLVAEGKICDNWMQAKDDEYKPFKVARKNELEAWFRTTILSN